ncbi:MAG: glycosyltransferase, partial [Aeoliella sp.]
MASFSTIIPSLNEADQIGCAITSAWNAGAVDVIVVDGGSSDETTNIALGAGAQV